MPPQSGCHLDGTGVFGRTLKFCPRLSSFSHDDLVLERSECRRFFLACCQHRDHVCHRHPLIFTDGSCLNNGTPAARAGYGVAIGQYEWDQHAIPADSSSKRTNNKAELAAASVGLMIAREDLRESLRLGISEVHDRQLIIACDSEHVVKGMTEWLPKWKRNNFKTSRGTTVENAEEFRGLDRIVTECENEGITVGFWRVPHEYNTLADMLAREAAAKDRVQQEDVVGGVTREKIRERLRHHTQCG
ncbi:ribonuclease H-like domain-containing protein [Phyllosticta capitalensis]